MPARSLKPDFWRYISTGTSFPGWGDPGVTNSGVGGGPGIANSGVGGGPGVDVSAVLKGGANTCAEKGQTKTGHTSRKK